MTQNLRRVQPHTFATPEDISILELLGNAPSNHNYTSFMLDQFEFRQSSNVFSNDEGYNLTQSEAVFGSALITIYNCGIIVGLCWAGMICSDEIIDAN